LETDLDNLRLDYYRLAVSLLRMANTCNPMLIDTFDDAQLAALQAPDEGVPLAASMKVLIDASEMLAVSVRRARKELLRRHGQMIRHAT
jgi:hypothetical protein